MAFHIIRDDITKVSADAIVNTANPQPVFGAGTDAAIYTAAGADELLAERKKIGDIAVGDAKATGAYALHAKYIIHTVGPAWDGGDYGEREDVRRCYENSLKLAQELGCESIAFPLIATGVYGFPKADALQIAISVFSEFLVDSDMEITMVVFDEEAFVLSGKIFDGVEAYIDQHYVEKQIQATYHSAPSGYLNMSEEARREEAIMRRRKAHRIPSILNRKKKEGLSKPGKESAGRPAEDSFRKRKKPQSSQIFAEDSDFESGMPADDFVNEGMTHAFFDTAKLPSIPKPSMAGAVRPTGSLEDRIAHVSDTWQESLFHLIDEKGYTDTEVYKRANIDRKLFSKIRSNAKYKPKKSTAVAFALALELNLDETRDFLARAGYALSPSSLSDLIVEYFIEQEVYDIYTINLALFDHNQITLGA